jgi:prepilin-type N-terminal cleavage/methylation domain-containing protein
MGPINIYSVRDGSPPEKQRGFTLLETMFATMILLVGVTGLMTLFVVAAVRNTNNGDQATRTTEYAQDKMEQLLALSYTDTTSNVAGFPTTPSGCTNCGLYSGTGSAGAGSLTTATTYYSDYIDTTGAVVSTIATNAPPAAYTRYWFVESPTALTGMKRISVKVVANLTIGARGVASSLSPTTTLVSFKSGAAYP